MTVEKYLKWSNDEQDLHLASLQNSKTQNLNNIFSLLRGKAKKAKPKTDLKQYHRNFLQAGKLLETFIQNSFPGGKTTIKSVGETQLLSVNFDDESAAASIVIKSGKSSKVLTVRLIPLIHADDIDRLVLIFNGNH